MRTLEISTFAFRLAAVYVGIRTILQASDLPTILALSEVPGFGSSPWIGYAATVGIHVAFGLALWFAGPVLARRLLGGPTEEGLSRAVTIGALAFRLAGVWMIDCAIDRARDVSFSLEFSAQTDLWTRLWVAVAQLGAYAIVGMALLVGGGRLAARIFGSAVPQLPLSAGLQAAAFSVLGLVIVVRALPDVLSGFTRSVGWLDGRETSFDPDGAPWPVVAVTLVRLGVGAGLFLGGGFLARGWHWAQTAGLDDRRTPSDSRQS